jgi:hypothetical protein
MIYNQQMGRPPILSGFTCYHCGSLQTCKAGLTSNGKRRFFCRGCGKNFREDAEIKGPGKQRYRAQMPSVGQLVLELQSIANRIGKPPTTETIQSLSKEGKSYPLYLYYTVFGSFPAALKSARLKRRYLQEFDEADRLELLNTLRSLSKKLKRPIIADDVVAARKRKEVPPVTHFRLAFGSVPKAIEKAKVAPKVSYSRDEMIDILRKIDATVDRPVQKSDIEKLYLKGMAPAPHTLEKKFGGMARARKAAGIKNVYRKAATSTSNWQKYTLGELVDQLKSIGDQLGRKPTDRDINRLSKIGRCASSTTFARMFGSLPTAYAAAGFQKIKPRKYDTDELRSALTMLQKKLGRFPSYLDIKAASENGESPCPGTVIRRLGKLRELRSAD